MSQLVTDAYLLRTLTNLHAGSGDSNYGIVDKEVQKDPCDLLPILHASSLKGAFRELLAHHFGEGNPDEGHRDPRVVRIFGSDSKRSRSAKLETGNYRFFDARLLVFPARSNARPFFRATSPETLNAFLENLEHFGALNLRNEYETAIDGLLDGCVPTSGRPIVFGNFPGTVLVDEFTAEARQAPSSLSKIQALVGEDLVLFENNDFKELCQRLPVIARNQLDNGISANLWYEETVPRETRFYFLLQHPDGDTDFSAAMTANGSRVQVGGNATVGYGLCQLIQL